MAVSETVERMRAAAASLEKNEVGARESLLELVYNLRDEVELPSDLMQRIWFSTTSLAGILEIAVNTKIFQHLVAAKDGISHESLSEQTGIEPILLGRFMRHLASHRLVAYSAEAGHWEANAKTQMLARDNYQNSILFLHNVVAPTFLGFPAHFAKAGYVMPTPLDAPFQRAMKCGPVPFFDHLSATPPYVDWFANFMSTYRAGKLPWWDFYPVKERLISGFDLAKSEALLVDVGGGHGHDLVGFAEAQQVRAGAKIKANSEANTDDNEAMNIAPWPGKLVLQDLPEVIAGVPANQLFEAQNHDFFAPQPVRARAYFMHSIMHGWNDETCAKILGNLMPAMEPGYSRILINEIAVSETSPSVAATSMDVLMLGHLGDSRERTVPEWHAVAALAGLEVTGVYSNPASNESIIEMGLPVVNGEQA